MVWAPLIKNPGYAYGLCVCFLWDHLFLAPPFRHKLFLRHLFRFRSFSAQIASSPIRCSLAVQLFRLGSGLGIGFELGLLKKHRIGAEKVRDEMVKPKSRGPVFCCQWLIIENIKLRHSLKHCLLASLQKREADDLFFTTAEIRIKYYN